MEYEEFISIFVAYPIMILYRCIILKQDLVDLDMP